MLQRMGLEWCCPGQTNSHVAKDMRAHEQRFCSGAKLLAAIDARDPTSKPLSSCSKRARVGVLIYTAWLRWLPLSMQLFMLEQLSPQTAARLPALVCQNALASTLPYWQAVIREAKALPK